MDTDEAVGEAGTGPAEPGRAETPETFRDRRPALYASRHVLKAVGEVAVGLLGVGAVVRGLLPRIDWPWAWTPRDLLRRVPDPLGWVWRRLDLDVPTGLVDVLRSLRWWVPVAIAVIVTVTEVWRRADKGGPEVDRDEPVGDDGQDG